MSSAAPALAETPHPNILLIVADDLGLGDLAQTPNINTLAAQGMRFSRFYTDSTCSASRAALLTGQNPARLGFHPVARGIDPDVITMPEWFRMQGYSTHHIGKWHIGELNAAAKPVEQGFDTSFGFLNQWFLQGPDANGKPVLRPPVYDNPWLESESGEWRQYSGYLPDILTQRAAENIVALATTKQPWFMLYATLLPHSPLHVPPKVGGLKNENNETDDQKYAAMLRHLDKNISELMSALEKSGQRDNTIIVFLSDNGAPEKRSGSNGGFDGGKAHYSEGAVRTPMIWVDAGRTQPASLDERAIAIADVFPTLAASIGAPLPFKTDGIDFNNLANSKVINERPLYWMSRGSSSMLSSDKLWRVVDEWMFREKQSFQLLRINSDTVADKSNWRYWYFSLVSGVQQDFLVWLDDVSRTQVKQESANKITSNDFLRTPLKEWDFYIAAWQEEDKKNTEQALVERVLVEQVLAEQEGVWSLSYSAGKKLLSIDMYGHQWQVPFVMPQGCVMIGLNADVYDRYTNISDTLNSTKLLLSVNGKEVARTEWKIDSLANVEVTEPTWLGISAAGDKAWQGKLSKPAFYHRANKIGEWPYLIDELALQRELCASSDGVKN